MPSANSRSQRTFGRATTAVVLLVLTLLAPLGLRAQNPASTPPQEPTPVPTPAEVDDVIRINTNLVQVDAVVTDSRGRQVTDLQTSDFELIEEGQSKVVDHCSYVSLTNQSLADREISIPGPPTAGELGSTLVFLVDNPTLEAGVSWSPTMAAFLRSRSIRGAIEAEKVLTWFVDKQMTPRDLIAIADTEVDVGVLSSFTNDRALLHSAIRQIRESPTSGRAQPIRVTQANGQLELSQLMRQNLRVIETVSQVIDQLKTLPGRKIVSLLSRGMLFDSRLPGADVVIERMEKLISHANRAQVAIYALSPAGVGNFGGDTLQNFDSLIRLARETGGRAIYNTNDTRLGFADVLEENRGYYLLGYNPGTVAVARPHSIKVRVKRPGLRVTARTTAYNREALNDRAGAPFEELAAALRSPLAATGLELSLTPSFLSPDGQTAQIVSFLRISLSKLDLFESATLPAKADFDLAVNISGPDGRVLRQRRDELSLTLPAAERDRALREGLLTRFEINAGQPGFYRVKVAVRERSSGRIGSTTRFVEVAGLSRNKGSK